MCIVENCNLENFEDKDKCILHCEKDDWKIFKRNQFWQEIKRLKKEKYFKFNATLERVQNVKFPYFDFIKLSKYFPEGMLFFECDFNGIYLREGLVQNKYLFSECIFHKDIKFIYCDFNNNISFYNNCIFKEKLTMSYCNFYKLVLFNNCIFKKNTIFSFSYFAENVFFTSCVFKRKLNLSKTLISGKSTFHKTNLSVGNRETARIIKNSFEEQNNIIEANKYYALEMKERDKELTWKENFFDKLVFKFHGLSSNHSQNWLLPIFWIFFFGLFYSYLQPLDFYTLKKIDFITKEFFLGLNVSIISFILMISLIQHKWFYNYISSFFLIIIVYLNMTNDIYLKDFANNINPSSIMTKGEELTFGTLLFKIIIAYLIYQLVVSIRQNTRRK